MLRIFLDMDGVLADFNKLYSSIYGCGSYEKHARVYNQMRHDGSTHEQALTIAENVFANDVLHVPDFWLMIEPIPYCHDLIHAAFSVTRHVSILTAIPDFDRVRCVDQKLKWIEMYTPELAGHVDFARHIPVIGSGISSDKDRWVTSSRDLLVDDSLNNCRSWIQAGGSAFHISSDAYVSKEYLADFSWVVQQILSQPCKRITKE